MWEKRRRGRRDKGIRGRPNDDLVIVRRNGEAGEALAMQSGKTEERVWEQEGQRRRLFSSLRWRLRWDGSTSDFTLDARGKRGRGLTSALFD